MITDFDDLCLWTYVIVDDMLIELAPLLRRPGPPPPCGDSELITMILVAECKGWDIETQLLSEFSQHPHLFPILPSQSRLNRRRRHLGAIINQIRQMLLSDIEAASENLCIIDSLPIPVIQIGWQTSIQIIQEVIDWLPLHMNFKTTLIILAVFILLGGAYFFFGRPSPDAEQSKADQQKIREVYALSKDKIQKIRLSFKDESYQSLTLAQNADGIWQLKAPFTANADPPKINEMLQDLLEKKVKQTLEAEDLAQYGLQPPNIRIELWTEGETPAKTFLIGDRTVNYSVYTKEQSESHIFLIESSALDDFTKSPSDFRDRDVFKLSPTEIGAFRLQVAGQPEIRCEKQVASNTEATGQLGAWQMIQPVKAKADARVVEEIVSALGSLRVVVFEADGEYDLADYGLSQPRITVTLQSTTADQIQELQIGSDAGTPGRIYVASSEHHAVYAVNKEIYTKLNRTVFDLRDKRVIDFQRTATHRFTIRQEDSEIVCQKDVDGEWEITAPVALKADEEVVDDLLFGVDALRVVAFVDDQPKNLQPYGLDSPSIEVSFMVPNTEPAVLLVGKMKGDNIYVKAQNAEPVFLVKKDTPRPRWDGSCGTPKQTDPRF